MADKANRHFLVHMTQGGHYCVDLTDVSQACRVGGMQPLPFPLLSKVKNDKHSCACISHGFDFSPISLSTLRLFYSKVAVLLDRFCGKYVSHARIPPWKAHPWAYHRLSFSIMHSVTEQFVCTIYKPWSVIVCFRLSK